MAKKVEPRKYSLQYPQVAKILGAYFHEDMFDGFDWKQTNPNYISVVRYIKSRQEPMHLLAKISELREFLAYSQNWSEDKLEDILLNDFGGSIYAPGVGITYREFLQGILAVLEEPTEKTQGEFIPKFIG